MLAKYAKTTYDSSGDPSIGQKTKIVEIGYIIKEFNARVSLFYNDIQYGTVLAGNETGTKVIGVGLQLQM